MILVDFLMRSFFVYGRNRGRAGKAGAIIGVSTVSSSILLFTSVFVSHFLGLSIFQTIGPLGFGALAVLFYMVMNLILTKLYIKNERGLEIPSSTVVFYIALGPLLFFVSTFLLFLSLRYF